MACSVPHARPVPRCPSYHPTRRLLLRRRGLPVAAQHLPLPPLGPRPGVGLGAGAPGHQLGAAARQLRLRPATRRLPGGRRPEPVRLIREYRTVYAASWSSLYLPCHRRKLAKPASATNSSSTASVRRVRHHMGGLGPCAITHARSSVHLQGGGGSGSRTCAPAIQPWYDEVRDYRFTSRPWSDNSGRFRWAVGLLTATDRARA